MTSRRMPIYGIQLLFRPVITTRTSASAAQGIPKLIKTPHSLAEFRTIKSTSFRSFVRKPMHGLGALRKRIQQRGAPATGRIRCRFLVGLFVGLREKLHLRIRRFHELVHGDGENHVSASVLLLHREIVKPGQLVGGLT